MPETRKSSTLAVWAWAFYDFSNTIFSLSILSVFFPRWLEEEFGAGPELFNFISAVAALGVVLAVPLFGALADLRQRRMPYLVVLTFLSAAATAGLDLAGSVVAGMALFVAADVAYQSALVFYNALLPGVSAGRSMDRVSGYGTGVGYVGAIFCLIVLTIIVTQADAIRAALGPLGAWIEAGATHSSNAFLPTAVLYLLFSLPSFFLIPDRRVCAPRPFSVRAAYRDVISTVGNIRLYAGMGAFILATLLYMDAASTTIANMSLYGTVVFGMDEIGIAALILVSTTFAVAGSVGFGYISDRAGPKRTLLGILCIWVVAIALVAISPAVWMLFVAGPLVGVSLGATWTVSRTLLVALSPPEKVGEFFGLYGIAGKVSAVLGSTLLGVLLTVLGGLGRAASYRISIGSLVFIMLISMVILLRVPDARPGVAGHTPKPPRVR